MSKKDKFTRLEGKEIEQVLEIILEKSGLLKNLTPAEKKNLIAATRDNLENTVMLNRANIQSDNMQAKLMLALITTHMMQKGQINQFNFSILNDEARIKLPRPTPGKQNTAQEQEEMAGIYDDAGNLIISLGRIQKGASGRITEDALMMMNSGSDAAQAEEDELHLHLKDACSHDITTELGNHDLGTAPRHAPH